MDNLSAHDTSEVTEWFDEHPRWARHFTPKHASLDAYVAWYLAKDRPFRWSYRPKSWD